MGRAWVLSSADGKALRHWKGTDHRGGFGGVIAPVSDLDGDATDEVAVAAPATEDQSRTMPGELFVYSGRTGVALRHWTGRQPGEQFARIYRQQQLQAHQQAVQLFENATRQLGAGPLGKFASETLPVLRRHLEHVKTLAGSAPGAGQKDAAGTGATGAGADKR